MRTSALKAFYLFTILWAFNPTGGLWILYLLHCHWTLFQVGLGEAGFHLVSFLFGMPTGLFADRWGRRKSLGVGLAVQALTTTSTLLWAPTSFILGFISISLGALAWSFIDGADRALLFSIVDDGDSSTFGRVYGSILAVNLITRALATAMGGWMVAHRGWYMPYGATVLSSLLGLLAIKALPENRSLSGDTVPSIRHMAQDLSRALGTVQKLPGLSLWVLLGSLLATMVTINNLYAQSTLALKGASLESVSLLVALAGIATALGSWVGGRIGSGRETRVLSWGTLILGVAVGTVGLLPLKEASVGYVSAAEVDGTLDPLYESALNRLTPDALRATILSIPGTGFSLGMIFLFPLMGWAMGAHHVQIAYGLLTLGLCVMALGFASAERYRGKPRKTQREQT